MKMIRTIPAAVSYYKENDPDTHISEYIIRRLIQQGKIPAVKNGRSFLVAIESIDEFFAGVNLSKQAYEEHKKDKPSRRCPSFTPII